MTPDCTTKFKCWEHFQGWHARVTQRDIALAQALVKLRLATLDIKSTESISQLQVAVHLLRQLFNSQWRQMVRKPFQFKLPSKEILASPSKTLTIEDLDLDL